MTDRLRATLDIGHSCFEDDLNSCMVYKDDGEQNFKDTLNNYIELLKKSINVLELIRDTTNDSEFDSLELTLGLNNDCLEINGESEIIERYVGFGIASYEDNYLESLSETGSTITESSNDYNEIYASDDSDTPIGSDSEESEPIEEVEEVEEHPKKIIKKVHRSD